ncbi:MAG: hypothetical protein K6E24_02120 [bacterium]|nr:hypothetical protein [bacterium]
MRKINKIFSVITLTILAIILAVGCEKKTTPKTTKKDNTTAKVTTNKKTTSNSTTRNNTSTKETKKSYSISLEGEISGVTCSITALESSEGTATYVPVDITEKQEEGKAIFVSVTNLSNKNVKLTATIGTTVKEVTIKANTTGGFHTPTDCLTLTADLNLKLEELEEVTKSRVTLSNDSEVIFSFYYYVGGAKFSCNSSTEISNGTVIYPSVTSTFDFDIMVAYYVDGKIMQKMKVDAGSSQAQTAEFTPFEVTDDVFFDYTIFQSCKLEFNSKVEGANFVVTNKSTDELVTTSGLYFDSLTEFEFGLVNNSGNKVIVNIYQYDEDVAGLALIGSLVIEDEEFTYPQIVAIYDDLKLEIVDYVEYDVTYETAPDGITIAFNNINPITHHGENLEEGAYPAGTIIYASVLNNTDKKIEVRVVDSNDTTNVITTFEVDAHDYGYADDVFMLLCDITVNIIFDEPALPSYTLKNTNSYSDVTINAYYFTEDDTTLVTITPTTEIPYGASILIEGNNASTNTIVKMYLMVGEEVISDAILGVGDDSYGQIKLDSIESDIEINIEFYQEVETYSVYVSDSCIYLGIKLYTKNGEDYTEIENTNCILKGKEIYVRVVNTSENPYIVAAYFEGGEVMLSGVALPTQETLIGSFVLTRKAYVSVGDYSEVTITYETIEGVTINCYDTNNNTINSGDKVFTNKLLTFEVVNGKETDVIFSFAMAGLSYGFKVEANSTSKFGPQAIPADFSLTVEEYVEYNVSITNNFPSKVSVTLVTVTEEGMVNLKNGDKIAKNAPVMLYIENSEETSILILTIKNGSDTVYSNVLGPTYGEEADAIAIKGDFSITITLADTPTGFIVEDQTNEDVDVVITIGENDDDFDSEEEYEEGTLINLYISNNTDDNYIIYILNANEQNIKDPIIVAADGLGITSFTLTCDAYITCEIVEEDEGPFVVNYNYDIENFTVKLYPDDGDEEVAFGSEIEKGSEVYIRILNELDYDYTITVLNTNTDEVIESLDGYANSGDWFSFILNCDCYITVEINYEDDEMYSISVNKQVNVDVSVYYLDEDDEEYEVDFDEYYEAYTSITVYVNNTTENPIIVEILDEYSLVIDDLVIYEGDNDSLTFGLESDVTIYIGEYSEEEDELYINIYNNADDENITCVVRDENDHDVTEMNIAKIDTLSATITNNLDCDIIVVIEDASMGVLLESIVKANNNKTLDFGHDSDIYINIYKYMNAKITVQGDFEDFTWEINDDFEDTYEDGDTFHYYDDDLYFDGINSSSEKAFKVTIYDSENESIGSQTYYYAPEGDTYRDGVWFFVRSDVLIVIEEIEPEEFTLTISTDLDVRVLRGSISLNDGDTIYGGEGLYVDFNNDTDQDINVIGLSGEDMIFTFTCEAGEFNFYSYEGVSSDIIIITATGSVFPVGD